MKRKSKSFFWITTCFGGALPVIIDIITWLIHEPLPAFKTLFNWARLYFTSGPFYFVFATISCAVPFMVLYVFANELLKNKTPLNYVQRFSGVILASLSLLIFSIYINSTQSYNLYQASHEGPYEGASTAGLTFIIFPILAISLELLAYIIGWGFGKLITIFRNSGNTRINSA